MESTFYCSNEPFFQSVDEGVRGFVYNDYSISPHEHEFFEINVILSGSGTHVIEDRAFTARKGNVFLIPPGTVHAYESEGGLDVFHLLLHPRFFEEYTDRNQAEGLLLLTEIEPFLRKNGSLHFLKLSAGELLALQSDLEVLTDGSRYDYEGSNHLKRYTALKVLYYWSHLLSGQTYEKAVSAESERAVIRVLEHIHKRYGEKISVQELCEVAYMTRSTLFRHFKAICGCTPSQYLQSYRVKCAREGLQLKKRSKTEIAQECGFYDLSHMERELKKSR